MDIDLTNLSELSDEELQELSKKERIRRMEISTAFHEERYRRDIEKIKKRSQEYPKKIKQFLKEWRKESSVNYEKSSLSRYFLHDTWPQKNALLILSDIDPTGRSTLIDWDADQNSPEETLTDRQPCFSSKLINVTLFSANDDINDSMSSRYRRTLPARTRHNMKGNEQKDILLKKTESLFLLLEEIWQSNPGHKESCYPIQYYIDWAERKGIEIPWKKWATENGYWPLDKSKNDNQPENPKKIKTLLLMLAGAYKDASIDWNARSIAKKIQGTVDRAGGEIKDLQTIRNVLKEIDTALN